MVVDINHLSSDELFELAKLKRQREEDIQVRSGALATLKERRKQLELKHAKDLESVDTQISELHKKRAQLVIMHKAAVDAIDREIAELARDARSAESRSPRTAAKGMPAKPERVAVNVPVDFASVVLEVLAKRNDISESLLKEQLRARRVPTAEFSTQMERLIRAGRVVSKGGGNYALGKKR